MSVHRRALLAVAGVLLTTACSAAPTAEGGFVGGDGSITVKQVRLHTALVDQPAEQS